MKTCSWTRTHKAEPQAVLLVCRKGFFIARLGHASTKHPPRIRSPYSSLQLRSYQNQPKPPYIRLLPPAGWSADRNRIPAFMGRWPQGHMTLQRLVTQFGNFSISPRNFKSTYAGKRDALLLGKFVKPLGTDLLASPCLSVCQHWTARLSAGSFSLNSLCQILTKVCRHLPTKVEIGRK